MIDKQKKKKNTLIKINVLNITENFQNAFKIFSNKV
jgi:hypothetical protein